jgi:hypothetical protein
MPGGQTAALEPSNDREALYVIDGLCNHGSYPGSYPAWVWAGWKHAPGLVFLGRRRATHTRDPHLP